jgi:hypothetical protein
MKTENKTIKHTYTLEERDQLGADLARAFGSLRGVEMEFDQVKSSYKTKTAEAEARIDKLATARNNGFEFQETPCVVVYRPAKKEKEYYLTELEAEVALKLDGPATSCVLTEKMTADDFQQELIEAESKFDAREEIQLFAPADGDRGLLVVGRFAGKWFGALRVKIGKLELNERLDSEQPCTITRSDAVKVAVKRVNNWAKDNLKDLAAGFQASFSEVEKLHSERVE